MPLLGSAWAILRTVSRILRGPSDLPQVLSFAENALSATAMTRVQNFAWRIVKGTGSVSFLIDDAAVEDHVFLLACMSPESLYLSGMGLPPLRLNLYDPLSSPLRGNDVGDPSGDRLWIFVRPQMIGPHIPTAGLQVPSLSKYSFVVWAKITLAHREAHP